MVAGTSAAPYILASKLLIHTGCTTGIEAAVAGQPALSLIPASARIHDQYLLNIVNPSADIAARIGRIGARTSLRTNADGRVIDGTKGRVSLDRSRQVRLRQLRFCVVEIVAQAAGRKLRVVLLDDAVKRAGTIRATSPRQRAKMTVSDANVTERLVAIRKVPGRFYNVSVLKLAESLYLLEARG